MKKVVFIKKKRCYGFIILASYLLAFLCSCNVVDRNLQAKSDPTPTAITTSNFAIDKADLENQHKTKRVTFKGVSLETDILLVSEIARSEEPAQPLELETDKPDGVWPKHISLKLRGEYYKQNKDSFFPPEINIYPIEEFRLALAKSPHFVKEFDKEIMHLQSIIAKKPSKVEIVPRIPFYDGTPELKTRVKYLSFKNGRGFFHLTQFNIEAYLINNRGLTYIFQGISSDDKYYVLGTFPVALDFLPDNYGERKFGDYELPEFWQGSKNWKQHEARYREYLSSIEKLLRNHPADDFNPSLIRIEETMASLDLDSSATQREP